MDKYDIFISYSRKDTAIADRICAALERQGFSFFIDRKGVGGGMEFPAVLADAILHSHIMLFLGSENSYQSKFTNKEITFAFNEKPSGSLLPYIIDGSELPPHLRFTFSDINIRTLKEHPIETVLMQDLCQLLGHPYKPVEEAEREGKEIEIGKDEKKEQQTFADTNNQRCKTCFDKKVLWTILGLMFPFATLELDIYGNHGLYGVGWFQIHSLSVLSLWVLSKGLNRNWYLLSGLALLGIAIGVGGYFGLFGPLEYRLPSLLIAGIGFLYSFLMGVPRAESKPIFNGKILLVVLGLSLAGIPLRGFLWVWWGALMFWMLAREANRNEYTFGGFILLSIFMVFAWVNFHDAKEGILYGAVAFFFYLFNMLHAQRDNVGNGISFNKSVLWMVFGLAFPLVILGRVYVEMFLAQGWMIFVFWILSKETNERKYFFKGILLSIAFVVAGVLLGKLLNRERVGIGLDIGIFSYLLIFWLGMKTFFPKATLGKGTKEGV